MKKFQEFRKIYEQEITLDVQQTQPQVQQQTQPQVQQAQEQPQQAQVQASAEVVNINSAQSQNEPAQETTSGTPVDLFSKLFEVRQVVHEYHLQVKGDGSYAAHVALNDLYDGVLSFTDELIEVYQGQYGIVEEYKPIDNSASKSKDKISYLEELTIFIKESRKSISVEDTHLHNIIDEIVAIVYKTLYKLKNLK